MVLTFKVLLFNAGFSLTFDEKIMLLTALLVCLWCPFFPLHFILFGVVVTGKLTPAAFEKHSGRETARKWKNNVWVIVNGEKVPLCKTVLLKYYNQTSKTGNGSNRSHNGRVCHRDEFIRCTRCNKERRFRLRTKEECRIHHDAFADGNWKCADLPYDKYVVLNWN